MNRLALLRHISGLLLIGLCLTAPKTSSAQEQPPSSAQEQPSAATPAPLTEEELKILDEVEEDVIRFTEAAGANERRVQTLLYDEYFRRKTVLEKRFARKIDHADKEERTRRLGAMALLEQFIKDHPNHPQFTPDAMYRLADLYLDEANFQYEQKLEAEELLLAQGKELAFEDEEDTGADYSKSMALWQRITRDFVNYRQRGETLYLYGYYLKQVGEERKALQVYRGLVCANKYKALDEPPPPPSRAQVRAALAAGEEKSFNNPYAGCTQEGKNVALAEDAWARGIGDIHFLTPGELNEAVSAYEKVASNKDSEFYEEALYKLAWSYYRNDQFIKGIEAFDESVVFSDKQVALGKDPLELRPEALQYIAISFTDPWSVDEQANPQRSLERALSFYKNRMSDPHVRDVMVALGGTFEILEAREQAIEAWRLAVDKWPLHAENPKIHQKIVSSYEAMGDQDMADDEASILASRYAPNTDWYKANETNPAAMDDQARISERMLKAAAENSHKAAQSARQDYVEDPSEENKEYYLGLYAKAAKLYKRFLSEYPTANESYEFTFRLGETLFWSGQFMASIPHYKWVRDHRELSEERFEKAAYSVVGAYQKQLDTLVDAGTITKPPIPTLEDLAALPKPIQPQTVPPAYISLRDALDEYQQLVNDPKTAPNMGILAALISYRFLDLNDAVKRFEIVFTKFCGTPESVQAKDSLLAVYESLSQDDKFKETNNRFIAAKCGTDEDIALAQAQNRSKEFRVAERLFTDKAYGNAALAFYKYYKKSPEDDPNLPVALYNAAIAYERSGKPKTAVYLFKEFTDNKGADFRKSEYYLPALYLTAVSYYKAFDYENAVDVYLQVVTAAGERGRKPPAGQRTLEQMRLDALYNAAVLRELDRVYKDPRRAQGTGAASLFARYAKLEKDKRKQDRALWAVARVWEAAGDMRRLKKAYEDWRRRFGQYTENKDDYVFTFYNIAKRYQKRGDSSGASRYRQKTIKAWRDIGQPKGTAAADMAAEFAFTTAESYRKRKFDKFKITRAPKTEKDAKRTLDKLDKVTNDTMDNYKGLGKYDSGFWGLAALVRLGDSLFFSSLKLQQAPIPKEIIKLDDKYPDKEILLRYEENIEALVKPKLDAARGQWEKVLTAGQSQGVSNEWIQLAQERLHDFVSQEEFPVLRQELIEGTESHEEQPRGSSHEGKTVEILCTST